LYQAVREAFNGLYGVFLTLKDTKMDITLNRVNTLAIVNKQGHVASRDHWSKLIIYTDKGEKIEIDLFGDKPLTIQLGDNE
jgi:hypothetical protein